MGDTSMVFRVDFQNQDVSVVGFPRDLWVVIPDVEEDNGRTHGKLNQAYFFGTEGMGYYRGEGYGAGLVRETLLLNYDLEIDKFIVINMRALRDVIDAVGGIPVYNPAKVYSWNSPGVKFMPGGYFFSGKDALLYARYRDPKNFSDRVDRQAIVLEGLFKAIFSLKTIPKIPEIIGAFKGNVLTDMHLAELSQFLCLAAKTDLDQVRFGRIPKDLLYIPGWEGFVWLEKEPGSITDLMKQFQDGSWPVLEEEEE
jgi:LCP family protein required for cell wall assembly